MLLVLLLLLNSFPKDVLTFLKHLHGSIVHHWSWIVLYDHLS